MIDNKYLDHTLPVEERVDNLMSQMTLADKISQTIKFNLKPGQIACHDDSGKPFVERGEFRISIGGGQPHAVIRCHNRRTLCGD